MNDTRGTRASTYLWRFVAGHHLSGKKHTNSTFRYRATRDLTNHGRASKWAHRAGWERASIRISFTVVTLAILWGFLTARSVTIDSLTGAFTVLTVLSGMKARFAFMNRRHHKRIVRPLYQTMTMITQINTLPIHVQPYGVSHKRYLTIPRNYRNPKARVKFMVPETWEANAALIKRLNDLIERRLGGDWDAIPHLNVYPPHIEFMPSPAPPNVLTFADMRAIMDAGKENEIIIGKGTHDRVISIDLDNDSPHLCISSGTGGGKSVLLRVIIAYLIHHGVERIDIIDPKRVSQNAFRGIPGVYIHRTMAEQMAALSAFRKRMESRYDELDRNDNATFPRHVLVIEEQNSFVSYAKTFWDDYRNELDSNERGRTPRTNPAIGDLAYCLFQGRQAKMNIVSVFQSMSASAAGGRDLRENYNARVLMRFSPQTWTMLVGTRPIPRSSKIPGRARLVQGNDDREIQMIMMTEADAKAYALAGIRTEPAAKFDALRDVPADGAGSDEPEPMMTLRELVESGAVPVRYSTAKRDRTRAGDAFPSGERSPIGTLYRPSDVRGWFASRGKGTK